MLTSGLGCGRYHSPEAALQLGRQSLVQGDLIQALSEAEQGYQRFGASSPVWAWRFRILKAEALLLSGKSEDAIALLGSSAAPPTEKDSAIKLLTIAGAACAHLHRFPEADRNLAQAEKLCASVFHPSCGDVIRARGVLAIERGQLMQSQRFFEQSLSFARDHGDRFLEATALLNLGASALKEEHFDEAVDWLEPARTISTALGAGGIELKTIGNLGWAYYNLGDSVRGLDLSLEAEKRATQFGEIIDQLSSHTNAGYAYAERGDFGSAKQAYQHSLELAQQIKNKQHTYNALRALALVSVDSGDLEQARTYSDQAIAIARADDNRLNELYPLLVKGLVAAKTHDVAAAERIFREVEQDHDVNASLKWRAEHGLARLFEDEDHMDAADRQYRSALATFEGARSSLHRKDAVLPFSTNALRIYDDYLHFLVACGKTDEALRWADYSRARTLAEGLGLLPKGAAGGPPLLNAMELARRAKGTLLFYWLGGKQSYLWVVTSQKTAFFPLPAATEIAAAAQRYRAALTGPQDVLESGNQDGISLYRMLVTPAEDLLPKDGRVFIIPDGPLNNLNFETLLVPGPKLHYWVEDATISNASSLRMLAALRTTARKPGHNLLLIGDSLPPNEKYPELPKAAAQMEGVAKHFSLEQQKVLSGARATPAAYLSANPEQFSFIHFVAHGTASRLSPLDSAIVLSKATTADDSFKLYARDIVQHPLRADLVTISACYGSGDRSYAGEGLVGLSWAFLGAGAHNVIAALWEATDASTEQLMATFYDELDKGTDLDVALRTAKLSLIRGRFHNPFYWAPFQFYKGS